jgi:hypothetical protein
MKSSLHDATVCCGILLSCGLRFFVVVQAEYEREQIDWSYIQFVDNQDVLDLIEGKMGILDLLDEQCRFPTSTFKVGRLIATHLARYTV